MKREIKCAMTVGMLSLMSACAAQPKPLATTASVSETSLCLVMKEIPPSVAPEEAARDIGNVWDSDPTVALLLEHNARLRAACDESEL